MLQRVETLLQDFLLWLSSGLVFVCLEARFLGKKEVNGKSELRAIDNKGFIKLQRADAKAISTTTSSVRSVAGKIWDSLSVFKSDIKLNPDLYMCIGTKIVDFEGLTSIDQLNMLIDSELAVRDSNEEIILIGAKNDL